MSVGIAVLAVIVSMLAVAADIGWLCAPALAIGIVVLAARATSRWSWLALVLLCLGLTAVSTRVAISERRAMIDGKSCTLRPLDFDNDTVEQLDREWWPPRVLCRYGYSSLHTTVEKWRDRWEVDAPFVLAATTVAVGVIVLRKRRSVAGVGGPEAIAGGALVQ